MRICFPSLMAFWKPYRGHRGCGVRWIIAACILICSLGEGMVALAGEDSWEPLPGGERQQTEEVLQQTEELSKQAGELAEQAGEIAGAVGDSIKQKVEETVSEELDELAQNVKEEVQEKVEEKAREVKRNLLSTLWEHIKQMFIDFFNAIFSKLGS